jgi:hypothetical protein
MCWYCYWGVPEAVAKIFQEAEEELGESLTHFGPGHVVFEDTNIDDDCIQACLDSMELPGAYEKEREHEWRETTPKEWESLKGYLKKLLAIPEAERDIAPEDSHDDPSKFPPPPNLKLVKV